MVPIDQYTLISTKAGTRKLNDKGNVVAFLKQLHMSVMYALLKDIANLFIVNQSRSNVLYAGYSCSAVLLLIILY